MPVSDIYELPSGGAFMETYVNVRGDGRHLAAVTTYESDEQAMFASFEATPGDKSVISNGIETTRQELKAAREAELDRIEPWRHDNKAVLFFKVLVDSLAHTGRRRPNA